MAPAPERTGAPELSQALQVKGVYGSARCPSHSVVGDGLAVRALCDLGPGKAVSRYSWVSSFLSFLPQLTLSHRSTSLGVTEYRKAQLGASTAGGHPY